MAEIKTNAMRMLDRAGVPYQVHTYDHDDGLIDGVSVASKLGEDPNRVYKTLVTRSVGDNLFVFVIPVDCELDLKKAARAVKQKSVSMIHVSEINKLTGYIRGGCSPIGMRKLYPTVIHSAATSLPSFAISGGKIGLQVELNPLQLAQTIKADFADLVLAAKEEA